MKRAEKAFTLVELLVVISIIALLLAVLMPALAKVKEQGRTIICGTNLKNYGLATSMYTAANNDRFPDRYYLYSEKLQDAGESKGGGCDLRCRWHYDKQAPDGPLWPYLRDKNINLCPTFRNFSKSLGIKACGNASGHSDAVSKVYNPSYSYSINAVITQWNNGVWSNGTWVPKLPLKVSDVKRSAQCMIFSEENIWTIARNQRIKETRTESYSSAYLNDNLMDIEQVRVSDNIATYHKIGTAKRNDGYANCVFADGHVAVTWGRGGSTNGEENAFLEYGKPYDNYKP
jgi:prepilin-type N-terminal cleavage/methylation domain-containing protein/prepilin-type processing-associated H-X9-DG protein